MKDTGKQILDMDLADAIIDRPQGFSVGGRHFYLYPVTIGKMFLLGRLTEDLSLNSDVVKLNPYMEALRVSKEKKSTCCRILTYHTIRTKAKAFDNEFVDNRSKFFERELSTEDLATIMVMILTWDKTYLLIKHLNIDKEQDRMSKAMKAKKSDNNLMFGAQSIYGSLIDSACERYGWTFEYVVWEISYTNLRLILADSTKQVYLTDEEMRSAKITKSANYINGDDPEAVRRFIESTR